MSKLTIPELYSSAIRTVTVVFGSLFDNIYVRKYHPDGSVVEGSRRKVPIIFSEKTQYYTWIDNKMRRPDDGTKVGLALPRLSYELTGLAPDEQRQLNPHLYRAGSPQYTSDSPFSNKEHSPAAYVFNYTLTLWTNDMDTTIQVLEQILPYFKPEVSVKVKEEKTLPIMNDVHVVFMGISKQDNYTEGFEVNRFIQWDMEFAVYSNIWTPSSEGKIIREIVIDINDANIIGINAEEEDGDSGTGN